jgi:hypothetical protein
MGGPIGLFKGGKGKGNSNSCDGCYVMEGRGGASGIQGGEGG